MNWVRNSRSAFASRWLTAQSDSAAEPRQTVREAAGGDSERNSLAGMTNTSDSSERMPEVTTTAVLNGTSGRWTIALVC
jgi:hypothetical protein